MVKRGRGRPGHEKTEESIEIVKRASGCGLTAEQIAILLDIAESTLWVHYKNEIKQGGLKASMEVAQALFAQAISGNVAAQIFWCKTRLGWREVSRTEITGPDGEAVKTEIIDRPPREDREAWEARIMDKIQKSK